MPVETSVLETRQILIPNGPLRASKTTIPCDFAKENGGTENMANASHPGLLIPVEVGIDSRNPVVYLLQSETMPRGRKNGLTNNGCVGLVWFLC